MEPAPPQKPHASPRPLGLQSEERLNGVCDIQIRESYLYEFAQLNRDLKRLDENLSYIEIREKFLLGATLMLAAWIVFWY